jgi:site-specific DNA-methyltransferase (adenine-specific)
MREIAQFARPALIDGGHFLSFIDWRQWPNLVGALETANLRVNQMVVWDKQHFGMGWSFRNQHELIAAASKGVPRMADRGVGSVLSYPRPSSDWHPSPKPVELMRRLIVATTEPGELVVDPFAGSAPIAEACRDLGRRYIGAEIVEEYCQAAASRLSQMTLEVSA